MGQVDTVLKYGPYNTYKMDAEETLYADPYDVSLYSELTIQLVSIRPAGATTGQIGVRWIDAQNKRTGSDQIFTFDVGTTFSEWWTTVTVPSGAKTLQWWIKANAASFNWGCGKVGAGTMPTAFSDNTSERSSLLTAHGLYTGTVTADQVVAGILSALSGKAWFDLEKPEIVMESGDGKMKWKASPERPLELLDGEDNFAGGAAYIGNKVALVSSILTNMLNPETWVNVGELEPEAGTLTDGLSLHHSPIDDSEGVFEVLPYGSTSDRRMVIRALPREVADRYAINFYASAHENNPSARMRVMGNLGALSIWSQEMPDNGEWAQVSVGKASVDLSVDGSSESAELNVGDKITSTHQAVGADEGGPYLIKNGTKTYFSGEGGEGVDSLAEWIQSAAWDNHNQLLLRINNLAGTDDIGMCPTLNMVNKDTPSRQISMSVGSSSLSVGTSGPYFQIQSRGGSRSFERVLVADKSPPAYMGSFGEKGDVAYDASYMYVCTATNTWRRIPLGTW